MLTLAADHRQRGTDRAAEKYNSSAGLYVRPGRQRRRALHCQRPTSGCGCRLAAGSKLFDSSPKYGAAERVLGTALAGGHTHSLVATNVWILDDQAAEVQLARLAHDL